MFQPNSVIAGRYQVIRLVGQGGMSNLYLAYDRKYNNAIVVVKEMTAAYSDPKEQQMAVELFHREAKLLASLNHRHIPKVYDYFQFAGKYYLSMEFIDGEDLAQKLEAKKGPLPEEQVLEWGEQIATVLFYLHKHDPPIVFRDVKPSNIMLCDQGVKLIDFGIARHFDQAKKGDTMRIGSPGYAPPEQYAAQTDPRSDIYALGVTLHHALTGRDPTATQTPFLVPPARNLNPQLKESTAAMLARATQLDPADRYQNILEMKNDIKAILSRDKQSTRVVGAPPPPPGPAVNPTAPAVAAVQATQASTAAAAATSVAAAATNPSSTGANAAPQATGQTAQPTVQPAAVAKPAKRKRRWGRWLLAATVLFALGGGLYAIGASGRQTLFEKARELASSLSRSGEQGNSEETIRQLLLSGDPSKLLPLSSETRLSELTESKQPLYRLNLLSAAISPTPPLVIHLLYPDSLVGGPREEELFTGAARALAALNGQGGVEKRLLVVLPRSYSPRRLDSVFENLASSPTPNDQKILVVDADSAVANLPGDLALKPSFVMPSPPAEGLPWVLEGKGDLASLFGLNSDGKLLWAAAGAEPNKAERVEFQDSAESLTTLLNRSESENATLVVEASRVPKDAPASGGKLLLLAVGTSDLPSFQGKVKAEALVLGSPLRPASALGSAQAMTVSQAATFDALALTSLPSQVDYQGVTLDRLSGGKQATAAAVRYRWTPSGWIPVASESRSP